MRKQTQPTQTQTGADPKSRIRRMSKAQLQHALVSMLDCWERVPRRYRVAAVRLHKQTETKAQLLAKADAHRAIDDLHQHKFEFQLDEREPYA